VLAIAAALIAYFIHESFWLIFWGGLLGLSVFGALMGLLMEVEDNAKGGWLNP
jgi:ABC-type antimicrobial peptide transport system permease subunit